MQSLTSSLTIQMIDDVSRPARTVAQALKDTERDVKGLSNAMANTGVTDRFAASLSKLKLSAKDIETVSAAWRDYSKSAALAADASSWTKKQAAGVAAWERRTVSALREVRREEVKFAAAQRKTMAAPVAELPRRAGHGEARGGSGVAAGILGAYAAHETASFARDSLELYREFDRERRFGRAVMGITDAQQEPLVRQAIRLGGTTKYNDVAVLEAQRTLAARGLNEDQVLGMIAAAADLGQALNVSLPDAAKQLEGAIFSFKKPVDTLAHATASARQTADRQTKAAKIGGLDPEDIRQAYKYGGTPARLAGVAEPVLLAFAAISKRSNMGGDESGVAFRALMAAAISPTAGAKTAMRAAGLNYANYQHAPKSIAVAPFVGDIAEKYGVRLNAVAQARLQKIFSNPALLGDPARFMPAVVDAIGRSLGKADAKSKKSIAGEAARYRKASMRSVDVNALIIDLLKKLPGNLQLANALFGSKQGGRIAAALGDPATFKKMIDAITNDSDGYAEKISDERMAGFDGAVSRLEGSVKNLETAFGRAVDANGDGGALTSLANVAGKVTQAFAELPPRTIRAAAAIGAVGAAFAGFKGVEALMGGFGLKGSASALLGAAEALDVAAGRLGAAGGLRGGALGEPGPHEGVSGPGGAPGARRPLRGLGGARMFAFTGGTAATAYEVATAPGLGSQDSADDANAVNQRFDRLMSGILPKGWVTPAAPAIAFDPNKVWKTGELVGDPRGSPVADSDDRRAEADDLGYRERQKRIRDGADGLAQALKAAIDAALAPPPPDRGAAVPAPIAAPTPDDPEELHRREVARRTVEADYGDRRTVYHDDPEREREARRAASLSTLDASAHEAKANLDALNATVAPQVDTSSLQGALRLARELGAELAKIGSMTAGLPSSFGGRLAHVDSLGKTLRGTFTPAGPGGM